MSDYSTVEVEGWPANLTIANARSASTRTGGTPASMVSTAVLESATRDLRWVAAYWPDLTEARP